MWEVVKGGQLVMEGGLTWGEAERTLQYTDGVLWSGTPETYMILLPKVTPIHSTLKNDDSAPS